MILSNVEEYINNLSPFQTVSEEFENAALFLRLGLPCARNQSFLISEKPFKPKLFKLQALCFSNVGKHQPLNFRKR